MNKLVLIGGGGHCKSVLDTVLSSEQYDDIVILDQRDSIGEKILGCPIIGTDDDLPELFFRGYHSAFITVGCIKDSAVRRRLYRLTLQQGFTMVNIIDPSAIIARDVKLGQGIFVGKRAIINTGSSIGSMAIINTSATIEHENLIEKFVHISIGATLCGSVTVRQGAFIGANATIIQGITIGENSIVGAGSLVLKSTESNAMALGIYKK